MVLVSIDVDAARDAATRLRRVADEVEREARAVRAAAAHALVGASRLDSLVARTETLRGAADELETRAELVLEVSNVCAAPGAPLSYEIASDSIDEVRVALGRAIGSRFASAVGDGTLPDATDRADLARIGALLERHSGDGDLLDAFYAIVDPVAFERLAVRWRTPAGVTGALLPSADEQALDAAQDDLLDTLADGLRSSLTRRPDWSVAEPGLAVLLARPRSLVGQPRFAEIARLAAGPGGVDQVAAVHAAFSRLSPDERTQLVRLDPWLVGNLDGAPLEDRIAANRSAILAARAVDQRSVERLDHAHARGPWEPWNPGFGPTQPLTNPILASGYRAALEKSISYYDELLDGDPMAGASGWAPVHGHQVVLFDPDGQRFAEVVGSLDKARNIGVLVPGTGTNFLNMGGTARRARDFVEDTVPSGSLAMVTVMPGPMPQSVLFDAFWNTDAVQDASVLRDLVTAIDTSTSSPVTVVGHSYGGGIVGEAEHLGMHADRVLHVESAGAGPHVGGVDDYAYPDTPRYSMTAPGDLIALAQGHKVRGLGLGPDPDLMAGTVRLETGREDASNPRSPMIQGPGSHSGVFKRGSTSFTNIKAVLTGGTVELYTEPTVQVFGSTVVVDYPMQHPEFEPPTADVP